MTPRMIQTTKIRVKLPHKQCYPMQVSLTLESSLVMLLWISAMLLFRGLALTWGCLLFRLVSKIHRRLQEAEMVGMLWDQRPRLCPGLISCTAVDYFLRHEILLVTFDSLAPFHGGVSNNPSCFMQLKLRGHQPSRLTSILSFYIETICCGLHKAKANEHLFSLTCT